MSNNDNNTYVLVRDSNGENFLCPLNTNQDPCRSTQMKWLIVLKKMSWAGMSAT